MATVGMGGEDLRVHVETDAREVVAALTRLPPDLVRGPFQHPDWIRAWLDTRRGAPLRLALATVGRRSTEALLLALPLMLDRRGGVPCWTALDDGVSDYNAPMIAPDFHPDRATMRRIWERILAALPGGDMVFLEKMPTTVAGHRNPFLDLDGIGPSPFHRHPLPLAGGLDAVRGLCAIPRSLARKRRKLGRKGALTFSLVDGDGARADLDRLMAWRDLRYGDRPAITDFYRRLLADTDLCRLGMLRLDGEPIAGGFGFLADRTLHLLVASFDGRWARWSPGLLAIEDMIAAATAEGCATFDFTIGSEAYKRDFGVLPEPLWEIRAAVGLRGRLVLRLLEARRAVGRLIRRGLATPGLAEAARTGS